VAEFMGYFNLAAAFFVIVSMVIMLARLIGGPTMLCFDEFYRDNRGS